MSKYKSVCKAIDLTIAIGHMMSETGYSSEHLQEMIEDLRDVAKDLRYGGKVGWRLRDDSPDAGLLKEQEWHMLTEDRDGIIHGLPGDDGQYLMTDGKDIWIDEYVDGVDDGIILDSGRDIREIMAWRYMPELPKTDEASAIRYLYFAKERKEENVREAEKKDQRPQGRKDS